METHDYTNQIRENIEYQIKKLSMFWSLREKTIKRLLEEVVNKKIPDNENLNINQALTDSIMNSMASLIDYYYIYCFLRMGINAQNITKVQYRPLNNFNIRKTYPSKGKNEKLASMEDIRNDTREKIIKISQQDPSKLSGNDYWPIFFGNAIVGHLKDTGMMEKTSNFKFEYCDDSFLVSSLARKYHEYMYRFYCNEHFSHGVKYSIFLDINNCLKHNTIPYVKPKIEELSGELRGFLYFEFTNNSNIFLKPGPLKSIVEMGFERLKENLKILHTNKKNYTFEIEKELGIDKVITTDPENGYINDGDLCFYIDDVLMRKSRDATYIEAGINLKRVLGRLINDIEQGINLKFSELELS
ncbi:hypothetical protein [Pseudomonas sp. BGI-2]|uniref:hypothetical protein n=1 Tax=Pseudomonas sp. BGI-2 TaxID=2528211 RepID=UPI001034BE62|nr:hypothetical protein [Pseudomonas sp. BGI-2]TBN47394.1 hypothetical protein EYC95_09840 [Pseudomonas sp. BGI-2]